MKRTAKQLKNIAAPTKLISKEKAQFGKLLRQGSEAARNVPKELTEFQKMRLASGKPLTHLNVAGQRASSALKKAVNTRVNPEAATKKMTKAQRQAKEISDSYQKHGGKMGKCKGGC